MICRGLLLIIKSLTPFACHDIKWDSLEVKFASDEVGKVAFVAEVQEGGVVDNKGDFGWFGLVLCGEFDFDHSTVVRGDVVAVDCLSDGVVEPRGWDSLFVSLVDGDDLIHHLVDSHPCFGGNGDEWGVVEEFEFIPDVSHRLFVAFITLEIPFVKDNETR